MFDARKLNDSKPKKTSQSEYTRKKAEAIMGLSYRRRLGPPKEHDKLHFY